MTGRWSEQDRQTIDDAMGLPHYPSQAERDAAGAGAGLIVIFVLLFFLSIGFMAGCTFRALLP